MFYQANSITVGVPDEVTLQDRPGCSLVTLNYRKLVIVLSCHDNFIFLVFVLTS